MRQITKDAIQAFRNGEDFKQGNTEVRLAKGLRTQLLLHGNVIAVKDIFGNLSISNGGHTPKNDATGSITTKERLNGLPNVSIYQTNFQWFLNGEAWNGQEIKVE
jgi:hypothetical protein